LLSVHRYFTVQPYKRDRNQFHFSVLVCFSVIMSGMVPVKQDNVIYFVICVSIICITDNRGNLTCSSCNRHMLTLTLQGEFPKEMTCHNLGGLSLASHLGDPGSSPGQVMWDLWWTKRHWGRFPRSTSVSLPILIPPTSPHSYVIRAGTIGQLVADVRSGFSLTPPQETKKKTSIYSDFCNILIQSCNNFPD
jgi:hypothetical protein